MISACGCASAPLSVWVVGGPRCAQVCGPRRLLALRDARRDTAGPGSWVGSNSHIKPRLSLLSVAGLCRTSSLSLNTLSRRNFLLAFVLVYFFRRFVLLVDYLHLQKMETLSKFDGYKVCLNLIPYVQVTDND